MPSDQPMYVTKIILRLVHLLGIMGMQVVGWNVHEPMHDFITKKLCICIYDVLYRYDLTERHLHKTGLVGG